MRTTFGLIGFLAMGLAGFGCADDGDVTYLQGDDPVEFETDVESVVLASFTLSNGNTIRMIGLPELDEIFVGENTAAGQGEQFFTEDQPAAGPLELFARLTPEGTPVPRMIAELASDAERVAWLGERATVGDQDMGDYFVDIADLGWAPIAAKAGGSCDSATGYIYFEDNHCGTMGPYGYGVTEIDCDNTAWLSVQRTSADKMRHTYTRTAACNGTGRIRHSRDTASGWSTILDEPIPANSVSTYYSYKKSTLKYYRRARAERIDPYDSDAYVRNWTRYFSQVTSNAP